MEELEPQERVAQEVLRKKRNATGGARTANVLRMAACSLQRSKTALGAQFRRMARRKGYSVAVFAMARKLAILIYRMLRYGKTMWIKVWKPTKRPTNNGAFNTS